MMMQNLGFLSCWGFCGLHPEAQFTDTQHACLYAALKQKMQQAL